MVFRNSRVGRVRRARQDLSFKPDRLNRAQDGMRRFRIGAVATAPAKSAAKAAPTKYVSPTGLAGAPGAIALPLAAPTIAHVPCAVGGPTFVVLRPGLRTPRIPAYTECA
jgi:hypothetical protein